MQIKEFSQTENKDYWIGKIARADWSAGKYLAQILSDGSFYELCGSKAKVLLLTDENDWTFEGFSGELSFFELYGSSQKQYRDAYKIAEELSDED